MRYLLLVALIGIFSRCTQHPPTLREDTLLRIYKIEGTDYCSGDSILNNSCNGTLYLKKNGKALYFLKCGADTAPYYRGTYFTTQSGLQCMFNSVYKKVTPCVNCPPESRPLKKPHQFKDDTTWYLTINKTGCQGAHFYSRNPEGTFIYTRSTPADNIRFCSHISGVEAFIDFHCRQEPVTYRNETNPEITYHEEAMQYYLRRYEGSKFSSTDDDSVIYLHIHKKINEADLEPDLYVEINKTERMTLKGDIDKDGSEDLLLKVEMSEGSTTWHDLFLFTRKNGFLILTAVASDPELAICTNNSYGGNFNAVAIRNGMITGLSSCYTIDDPECCPSVKVKTVVKLENNALKSYKK
jgi:hypothetical protein